MSEKPCPACGAVMVWTPLIPRGWDGICMGEAHRFVSADPVHDAWLAYRGREAQIAAHFGVMSSQPVK